MISEAVIPDEGALVNLEQWRAVLNAGTVRLFANNFTPNKSSVLADFLESSFVGYARVTPAGFAPPFTNGDGKAESDSAPCSFTFTAGSGTATVFGMYIVDASDSFVLLAWKFLAPVILTPAQPLLSRVIQATGVSELP